MKVLGCARALLRQPLLVLVVGGHQQLGAEQGTRQLVGRWEIQRQTRHGEASLPLAETSL